MDTPEELLPRPRPPLFWRLLGTGWMGLALLVLLTFWQGPYLFNLISPFRPYLLLGLLALGLPLALLFPHRSRWIFVALPCMVGITLLPYLRGPDITLPENSPGARIAEANLWSGNPDLGGLRSWLAAEKPDIVALVEVSEAQRAQLESLPFAYKSLHPRDSNFGIGLLSQKPPTDLKVLEGNTPFPSLLATWPEFRLLVTHPIPPISREAREVGDGQVARLVDALDDGSSPLLVVGDLNATGWDLRMDPLSTAGLKEARLGYGFLPTWPTDKPYAAIPLDHLYIPQAWDSLGCRRGPNIGSDHWPIVWDIAWPGSAQK